MGAPSKPPTPLRDLQQFLADTIRARRTVSESGPQAEAVVKVVAAGRTLSPARQLDVYREQFWRRHLESLRDDYPTVRALMGDTRFADLAADFLEKHPPATFDLRQLGVDLPAFVGAHFRGADDAILADAARYDRAFMEAFDAPEGGTFDPSPLATAAEDAWTDARIVFQPSVRPVLLSYPLHAFRVAVRRGEAPGDRPTPAPEHNVVYRSDALIYARVVDPLAFALIDALRHGAGLGAACESVALDAGQGEDLGARLGGWFQEWTSLGWVREVRFP